MFVTGDKLVKYENNQATLYLKVTGSTKPEANHVGMFFGSNGQQTMDETIVGTKFADASYELALPLTDEMFGASTNVVLLNNHLQKYYTSAQLALKVGELSETQTGVSAPTTATPGSTVTVDVIMTTGQPLGCGQFELSCDDSLLSLVSLEQGAGLEFTGTPAGSLFAAPETCLVTFFGNPALYFDRFFQVARSQQIYRLGRGIFLCPNLFSMGWLGVTNQ